MSGSTIAIVGVGAIGGAVSAALSDLGRYELVLCARTAFESLVVEHPGGTTRVAAPVHTDPSAVSPVDWVLIATKAHQTEAAVPWLRALTGASTRWALLQNGVDHLERSHGLGGPDLAPAGCVPVIVNLPAARPEPGRVVQSLDGMLSAPDDADGRAFVALFEGARVHVQADADFTTVAWRKLLTNASLGGVCAFLARENRIASEGPLRRLVLDLMAEIAAVARAEGADIDDAECERVLDRVLSAAADHWSSISVDRREGRPMEWEARNAVVGRRARAHGIATPWNDALTALLRSVDVAAGRAR